MTESDTLAEGETIRLRTVDRFGEKSALDRPHVFAVVSWGAAATMWLAKALNSHPDILCIHAANVAFSGFEPRIAVEGVHHLALLNRFAWGYTAVGDVHGISRYDIPTLQEAFGNSFSAAVLVRDPLPRLQTQLAHYYREQANRSFDFDYVDDIIASSGLDFPGGDDARLFVHAANMLNAVVEEREVGPFFKTEEVTTRRKVFSELVRHLTGGRVKPKPLWAMRTLRMQRVNVHQGKMFELTEWHRDVLTKVVWPQAWDLYEELGYERPEFLS